MAADSCQIPPRRSSQEFIEADAFMRSCAVVSPAAARVTGVEKLQLGNFGVQVYRFAVLLNLRE